MDFLHSKIYCTIYQTNFLNLISTGRNFVVDTGWVRKSYNYYYNLNSPFFCAQCIVTSEAPCTQKRNIRSSSPHTSMYKWPRLYIPLEWLSVTLLRWMVILQGKRRRRKKQKVVTDMGWIVGTGWLPFSQSNIWLIVKWQLAESN